MKHYLMVAVALFLGVTANAQFYVAASGGYALGTATSRTGIERLSGGDFQAHYGSGGQGLNAQFRVGYFFNETFGLDLGFGYLAAEEQNVSKVINSASVNGIHVNATSKSNVIGFSPSLIYKFSNNIYGRFGALLKIGGSTDIKGNFELWKDNDNKIEFAKFEATPSGHLPFGVLAALGYRYDMKNNISLFVEAEYMGISVKSKALKFNKMEGQTIDPKTGSPVKITLENMGATVGVPQEVTYKDKSKNSEELADKSPYSSIGLNFGVMYSF